MRLEAVAVALVGLHVGPRNKNGASAAPSSIPQHAQPASAEGGRDAPSRWIVSSSSSLPVSPSSSERTLASPVSASYVTASSSTPRNPPATSAPQSAAPTGSLQQPYRALWAQQAQHLRATRRRAASPAQSGTEIDERGSIRRVPWRTWRGAT